METLGFLTLCLVLGVCYGIKTYDLPVYGLLSLVNPDLDEDWMIFKKSYNRSYADIDEELRRRLYWEDTIKFIDDHNYRYKQGEFTYTLGENQFTDMAEDEFEDIYMHGLILPEVPEEYPEPITESHPDDPLSLDWRDEGMVSSVKNQGACASCWAFSALGALEGQLKKKTDKLVNLSAQNLVDCCKIANKNLGCSGGWVNNAFRYIRTNGGIDKESCYPYEAKDGECRYNGNCSATSDKGFTTVAKTKEGLKHALTKIGPISISMDTFNRRFWSYMGGPYKDEHCNKTNPTHSMLAVGYGFSSNDENIWLLKNSWGTRWGMKGYVEIQMDSGVECGMCEYASYPDV